MRKLVVVCALGVMMFGVSTALFAGGVNLNINHSAEFAKTMNRYGSTEPDAVYFNPAGMAFMEDGFYLYLSNQTIYQPIDIRAMSKTRTHYKGTKYAWYFPNGYLVFKKDKWALGATAMGIGGGGNAEYNKGLQKLDIMLDGDFGLGSKVNGIIPGVAPPGSIVLSKVNGSSAVYAAQVCFAYEVMDNVSVAVGYRFMYAHAKYKIKMGIFPNSFNGWIPDSTPYSTTQNGIAHGVIGSLSFQPLDGLTVGLRGEWNSPLRLKNSNTKNSLALSVADSGKKRSGHSDEQVAAILAAGLSYKIKDTGLQVSASGAYQFNQFAQMKQNEKNYTGGYDLGAGLDYTFSAFPLNIGAGYLYSESGARPSAHDQTSEDLDSHSLGAGFSYKFTDHVQLTLAHIWTYYVPVNINKGETGVLKLLPARFKKVSYDVAIGLTSKVM